MKPIRRISALLRELAEAVDDYAAEQDTAPRARNPKRNRERLNEAQEHAAETVREQLRRGGIKVAS